MAWTEIELEAATWSIPAERSKNGRAHVQLEAGIVL